MSFATLITYFINGLFALTAVLICLSYTGTFHAFLTTSQF